MMQAGERMGKLWGYVWGLGLVLLLSEAGGGDARTDDSGAAGGNCVNG